ncbi:MAG: OsmC family protein [Bacteroidetes bacterium]|nr:OsmC family protein [Bacteroidota bacterium]
MEPHYYNVNVNWKNDRIGELESPELITKIEVATPPQFNKGIEGIWSPEHLFTAAVSSCYMTTFLAIAENSKLEFESFSCNSKGKLEQVDGKFVMSEVILEPKLTIIKSEDIEKANRILEKSEKACLISNSINSKISLIPHIEIANSIILNN